MDRRKKKRKKPKAVVIIIGVILVIYLGVSIFFINRFYFGTKINGIDIGGQTIQGAIDKVEEKIGSYNLEIEGRDGFKENISGNEIDLKFKDTKEIKNLEENQKAFLWPGGILSKKESNLDDYITYDEEKLNKVIENLDCFKEEKITNPKNPGFTYKDGGYEITDEVMGNKLNKEDTIKDIKDSIANHKLSLNLEEAKLYINPKYTKDSPKVKETKDILNKYVKAKITYTFGDANEVIDGSKINKWLSVSENLDPKIDYKEVNSFIEELEKSHNTVGQGTMFKANDGRLISVPGGNFGWKINSLGEKEQFLSDIKEGTTVTREPVYAFKGVVQGTNETGSTYVEIDLGKQHLWYYKDGSLVVDSDIVTGNESKKLSTPPGLFRLDYREKDATLKGENYSQPVKYWMPFNGGIGLHDASWREKFGGEIYKTNGSHGCANLPPKVAETIFNTISSGTPVICYNT
ncbi:L,D-transpeptidase family protein [Clostridium chrysemydis]|uniref:L,D-transpeptidase family protein n=1 Tax=Clostridium chrysemydis TaxID=2665504 RepID=UPI0018839F6F|nr:L,D-transpeptidase family protein [Clostridium chrysemydis]